MKLNRTSGRADALRSIPLLHDLSRSDLEQIAKVTFWMTREPGTEILRQGDVGHDLLLLADGTARVTRDGIVIGEVGPGDVIGEMALIDGYRRSSSVIADTHCEMLVVPYNDFWHFVESVPAVQRQLLRTLSHRVRDLEERQAG